MTEKRRDDSCREEKQPTPLKEHDEVRGGRQGGYQPQPQRDSVPIDQLPKPTGKPNDRKTKES